ncbi:MAG: endonuclease domain-containing protein [Gemmatimonadota bacterium]
MSSPEIRIHRLRTLRPDEITLLDGLPITTPTRTLLDLASSLETLELEGALARAERRRVTDREAVASLLAEHRWLPGGPALRALLAQDTSPAFIRSEAEKVFLDLIRRAHLPAPETNVVVEGYEVDFLWKDAWLVVEVDGFAYRSSRDAFEADRKRDAVLMAAGFRVLRVTWRHITREPEALVVRLQRAMTGTGDGFR